MMELNDEIIPFSYYYKFNEKGKYKIKYKFIGNLKILCGIFGGCSSLTNINLSNFDTKNVTNMRGMFYGCSSLTNIDLSNFDTKNVTDMGCMFDGCSSLTNIDLSNFDTKNVTDMGSMFSGCKSLKIQNVKTNDKQIIELMEKFLK